MSRLAIIQRRSHCPVMTFQSLPLSRGKPMYKSSKATLTQRQTQTHRPKSFHELGQSLEFLQSQSPSRRVPIPSSPLILCFSLSFCMFFCLSSNTFHQSTHPNMKIAAQLRVSNHVLATMPAPFTSHKGSPSKKDSLP
jgi:hypothetical protein